MQSGSEHTHTSAHASLDRSTISAYDWRAGRPKVARSPTETITTETSDHTYSYAAYTPQGPPTTNQTWSRRSRGNVCINPNGYSEITDRTPTTATPYTSSSVKMRPSIVTTDTSDVTSCSTCPSDSERTSTATDISSSFASIASESTGQSTVVQRHPNPAPRSPRSYRGSSQFLASTSNFQPLATEPPR